MNQKNKSIGGSDDIKHLSPDDLIISLYTCLNKLETKAKKEALLLSAQEIDNVDYTKFKNSIDSIQSPEITEDDLKKIITKMKFKTEDILVMHTKIKLFSVI